MRRSIGIWLAALAMQTMASPLEQRQAHSSSAATTGPTAALLETTISGKATTINVAVPTASSAALQASSASTSPSAADTASSTANGPTSTTSALSATATDAPLCSDEKTGPFCLPRNETTVYVGQTYWVTWNPLLFPVNSSITVALNYDNNSNIAAWTSDGMPREKSFVTVTMDGAWLAGAGSRNLTFFLISFSEASSHVAQPLTGPFVTLTNPGRPPPTPNKLPDVKSLAIGLPVGLGGMLLIVVLITIGMKGHRKIDVAAILQRSRRSGYSTGKSRRQRMGLKKGAIRLEEREILHDDEAAYTDRITPVSGRGYAASPAQNWSVSSENEKPQQQSQRPLQHGRDESLGSLVEDDDRNAFRREMAAQQMRRGPL